MVLIFFTTHIHLTFNILLSLFDDISVLGCILLYFGSFIITLGFCYIFGHLNIKIGNKMNEYFEPPKNLIYLDFIFIICGRLIWFCFLFYLTTCFPHK